MLQLASLFLGTLLVLFHDAVVELQCNGKHVSAVVESSEYTVSGVVQTRRE